MMPSSSCWKAIGNFQELVVRKPLFPSLNIRSNPFDVFCEGRVSQDPNRAANCKEIFSGSLIFVVGNIGAMEEKTLVLSPWFTFKKNGQGWK